MTEKKKMTKAKLLLSILLFTIAFVLLGTSIFGYIVRGQGQTAQTLHDMRTHAVLNTATGGLIDTIAANARLTRNQQLRKDKSFRTMGTDAFQALCDEAEQEARAEAEALYSDVSGVDTAALEASIPTVEEALAAYYDLFDQEQAAYAEIYTAVLESVGDWTAFVADKEDADLWVELQAAVPALKGHEELESGMIRLAKAQSEAQAQANHAEELSQLWSGITGTVSDWTVYAGMDAEAVWADLQSQIPALADEATVAGFKDELLTSVTAAVEAGAAETAAADTEAEAETAGETVIDYAYFRASDALNAREDAVNNAYDGLLAILTQGIPALGELKTKDAETVRSEVLDVIASSDGDFSERYTAYVARKADQNLVSGEKLRLQIASNAQNLLLLGIAILLIATLYCFWKPITEKMGVSRSIILLFFIFLILAAQYYRINVSLMLGNILERVAMYGVLALAMLPGIQCGIGLNMGMTIGCVSGLFAIVTALNYNLTGPTALIFSIAVGAVIAVPLGWAYALLLNRMKGNEMTISTYVGFSFVSLMCIGWMAVPYRNPKIIWMLAGHGLRVTHSLLNNFAHMLDNLLSFRVFGIEVPTGGILFFLFCCLLIWLFSKSRIGIRMSAVGSNPRFAEAAGINVDRMRILGTVLSTVLAAIGIVVYSQAFGYAQLYTAPKQLGFIAASAILIGGASVKKAKVSHVIIGVILFEGVLSMGQQVANEAVSGGGLSEVMRIMISNGIILYALTQSGGDTRG